MQTETKVWDKGMIQALIVNSDKALARALWNIFQRQTAAEQSALQTIEHNGRGFTGTDAQFLSDVARRLPRYDFRMTPRQIAKVRPKMKKYWRQLLEDIEVKGGAVSYKVAKSLKVETAKAIISEKATPLSSEAAKSSGFGSWGSA
jgi:hypothetical protein